MPTPPGIVVPRDFWRISVMGGILAGGGNEKEVVQDFLARGICALPLVVNGFYPGDYATSEEYLPALAGLNQLKTFGKDQWEAYWGIKPGDRIVLAVYSSVVVGGSR